MQNWQTALLALSLTIQSAVPIAAQGIVPQNPPQQARVAADDMCWTDWSEAAVVARRETLMPVEQASRLASAKYPGAALIKVTLCEEQGRFVYRLLLRERQGQLKSELLDARKIAGQ